MFNGIVTSIKRKLSKSSETNIDLKDETSKPSLLKNLRQWKSKLSVKSVPVAPHEECDNTALSPRALNSAGCVETDFAWPVIFDNNPNILDRFTQIVTFKYDNTTSPTKVSVITSLITPRYP